MARRRKKRSKKDLDIFGRAIRGVIAILILTAFVLSIAFSVKQLATFDVEKIVNLATPYLAKVGIGEDAAGEVAGQFFKRVTDLGIASDESPEEGDKDNDQEGEILSSEDKNTSPEGDVSFSIAILADSHIANDKQEYKNNKAHLKTALDKAVEQGVDRVIHVGDITNWGVTNNLKEAKEMLDDLGVTYYAIPGDRDLAQSVGTGNFLDVFDKNKYSFEMGSSKVVVFDNSANYTVISTDAMDWFNNEVTDADFVILSQPLFTDGLPLFNNLFMGSTGDDEISESLVQKQTAVRDQRDLLLAAIRESNVKAVIAGDHHKSSKITDGERGDLEHYVVGAVSETVNEYTQSALQSQRFSILSVYENGGFSIEDIVL